MARSLDTLLSMQRALMYSLGVFEVNAKDALLSSAIGMSVEAAEVLDELNKATRPWKPREIHRSDLLEETTDVLFYAFETFSLLGLTGDEIADLYIKKCLYNHARFLESITQLEREKALRNVRDEIAETKAEKSIYTLRVHGVLPLAARGELFTDEEVRFLFAPSSFVRTKLFPD